MTPLTHLPLDAGLEQYQEQANHLLEAWRAGDADAIAIVRHTHPRFLNPAIPWVPLEMSDAEARALSFDEADARLSVARSYDFQSWPALEQFVGLVTQEGAPVARFERAVEAVIDGNAAALTTLLRDTPTLVHARSSRITHFDPPAHRATLLHYVAANGVENYRQRTPANAVTIARMLLEAGAEVDALADLYGGRWTTMSLLVSSSHPAAAGVQVELVDLLVDFGASVETGAPVATALVFGFGDAAAALVRRAARVDTLAVAAGLGREADVERLLAGAGPEDRHRALVLAAQHGHAEIVGRLLEAGESPDRYNPAGHHAHTTPLHQAAMTGNAAIVRLLIERGARLDIRDTMWKATPLGWARYHGHAAVADYLRSHGAME